MSAALVLASYVPRYAALLNDVTRARQEVAGAKPFNLPNYLTATAEADMVARVLIHQYDLRERLAS